MSNFWQEKPLAALTQDEWESLCDGCAQCCLHKLEDEDTQKLYFTNVACHLLDHETCRCSRYKERSTLVPDCVQVTVKLASEANWLPKTCAYRLLAEGKDLPSWHPLLTGSAQSVHEAGMSVKDRAISEKYVHPDEIPYYIVDEDIDGDEIILS